jgi:hypothetical protein
MAGSYRHLVNGKNEPYVSPSGDRWGMIENMGDAVECIDELFAMIQHLSGGDRRKIHEAWKEGWCKINIPECNYTSILTSFDSFWERK